MGCLGNIIWLIFGGFLLFIEYLLTGLLFCLTIIGIPFGLQLFKLAFLSLWPFGKEVIQEAPSTGCLLTLMNILWIVTGGIWVALTHLFFGALLCLTIIGIPWGKQHFKLMELAFTPFGKSLR